MARNTGLAAMVLAATLAGCGGSPGSVSTLAAPPVQDVTSRPAATDAQAQTADAQALTAEEQAFARAPQPAVHAVMVARFFDALGAKYPDRSQALGALKERVLRLDLLRHRAMHAAFYNEFKDRTLDELRGMFATWLSDPDELISYMTARLDQVEGKNLALVAAQARSAPEILAEADRLMTLMPLGRVEMPMEAKPAGPRQAMIEAVLSYLAAKEPALAVRIRAASARVKALDEIGMRALQTAIWQDLKNLTLAAHLAQMQDRLARPAAFLAFMTDLLDRVEGLTPDEVKARAAAYPKELAGLEELMSGKLAPPPQVAGEAAAAPAVDAMGKKHGMMDMMAEKLADKLIAKIHQKMKGKLAGKEGHSH